MCITGGLRRNDLAQVSAGLRIFDLVYKSNLLLQEEPKLQADSGEELRATGTVTEETGITGMEDDVSQEYDGENTASVSLDHHIHDSAADLANYLKRPLRIFSQQWAVGDFLRASFNPWNLYLTNPVISRKVANYAYFRGTMKIKVQINGNAFYYGRGILSYNPYGFAARDVSRSPGNAPTVDNVRYSQRPHVILNPTESRAGELELPFVYDTPMALITEANVLGELTLSSFNRLAHANAATTPVTITVMAWFTDMELAGPTDSLPALLADSGDEYGRGIVSKPASAIAKAMGMLKDVPVIGPYALATSMIAKTTSAIASAFGYCRPVNLNPIVKFRPAFMGNMANQEIEEAVDKLALDPKQELTIDPRVCGVQNGKDEMTVSSMIERESYFMRIPWKKTDAIDALLAYVRVTPDVFSLSSPVFLNTTEWHPTPLWYGSRPFSAWRGSITYRFQIAASNYHRGRLRIVYDPLGSGGLSTTPPDFTSVYTRVVDISECREFELQVGWNQPIAFRNITESSSLTFSPSIDVDPTSTPGVRPRNAVTDNGALAIYVLNELTVPSDDDTNHPEINVFVRAGPDFMLAMPDPKGFEAYSVFPGRTPTLLADSGEEGEVKTVLDPIASVSQEPSTNLVYFGEVYHSFRAMLKRYCFLRTYFNPPSTAPGGVWELKLPTFPLYRGYDTQGVNAIGSLPFTFAKNTLMNWLTPCFVMQRGGIRWKYNLLDGGTAGEMRVTRMGASESYGNKVLPIGAGSTQDALERNFVNYTSHTWRGTYGTNTVVNPTAEVELPYYSPYKFTRGSQYQKTVTDPTNQYHKVEVSARDFSETQSTLAVSAYVAAGEDFNLAWLISAPVVYKVNNSGT